MKPNYWQLAAGKPDRDYSDVFLRFGVFFGGDAFKGKYDPENYRDDSYAKIIAEDMDKGDKIVLKKPNGMKWEIIAVGEIDNKEGDYKYFETFDDMDGWNVAHGRRVNWIIPKDETIISGLRRGTISRIKDRSVMEKVDLIIKSGTPKLAEDIPQPQKIMTEEDIIEKLIDNGLRPSDAEVLTDTFRRVKRLAQYYYKIGNEDVLEHETRTFLIVPLLIALGWAEQQMKIEWGNMGKIDIAFFRKPYKGEKKNNPCIMILESKRLGEGLTYAEEDVKYYAKEYPQCKKLIVSNGCCYRLYERKDTKWEYISYLNILKPRRKYYFEKNVRGAVKTFLGLMP